ncbi:hypothetical protein RRG08_064864 [Elysia crispata]|uniref:Uncharacterized protein n=1 Tax=Elysia crispata TaxID=231223 RepID=A0AAE1AWS5_9GAST|nr:hypothetical protein RRG08_064864 [Elysia crispata]
MRWIQSRLLIKDQGMYKISGRCNTLLHTLMPSAVRVDINYTTYMRDLLTVILISCCPIAQRWSCRYKLYNIHTRPPLGFALVTSDTYRLRTLLVAQQFLLGFNLFLVLSVQVTSGTKYSPFKFRFFS